MGEEIGSENYTTENLYMNRIANIEENTDFKQQLCLGRHSIKV